MAGWTNRGKKQILDIALRNATEPTTFYVALVTDATIGPDANTMADVTEIAAGNGYTSGGIAVARSASGFDVLTEDDTGDRAYVQVVDLLWTASGGTIPASGDGARHAVLIDDASPVSTREIYYYWDLGSARAVEDGNYIKLVDLEISIDEE